MTNYLKRTVLLVMGITSLWACSDDDEGDFNGTDNSIVSFELTKEGSVYKGAIAENEISVAVPANVSLSGATPSVIWSEYATIFPEPGSVTDWDSDQEFVVTSYSGSKKHYSYKIRKEALTSGGDVVLTTQEEVDAFAKTGITIIDGNLIIGKATGGVAADTLTGLSGLAAVTEVYYTLTVNPTYGGEAINTFTALQAAGSIEIKGAPNLEGVDFPELEELKIDLTLDNGTLREISLPKLKKIGSNLTGTNNHVLESLRLPALQEIGNSFSLNDWAALTDLELPVLESVGHLSFAYLGRFSENQIVSLPVLTSCIAITLTLEGSLYRVDIPRLESLTGLSLYGVAGELRQADFSALKEITGNLYLNGRMLSKVDFFPALQSIGGNFTLNNASGITTLDFPELKSIGGSLTWTNPSARNTEITNLDGFSSLGTAGRVNITNVTNLTSFLGLANVIGSLTEEVWSVSGCAYNPSYDDVVNGRFVMPEEEE